MSRSNQIERNKLQKETTVLRRQNARLRADKLSLSAENSRLEKNLVAARLSNDHLRDRYVPCPDHRDKHKTGDECLMCQLERVSTEPAPVSPKTAIEKDNQKRDGDRQ